VFAFGRNEEGQLGVGLQSGSSHVAKHVLFERHVVSLAAGDKHSVFVIEGGEVFWSGLVPGMGAKDLPSPIKALAR